MPKGTVIDYRNWHLALGRRFRSVKIWFVLRSYGVDGFQNFIRKASEVSVVFREHHTYILLQGVALNQIFVKLVMDSPVLTLVTPPSLALSVFRLQPKSQDLSEQDLNSLNQTLFKRISARPDIFLTQTILNGVNCIRMAIGASRTTETHIHDAFKLISEESELTLQAWTAERTAAPKTNGTADHA
jgi:aromatic-L-amino-acid/L-tryptophan decarboxylase